MTQKAESLETANWQLQFPLSKPWLGLCTTTALGSETRVKRTCMRQHVWIRYANIKYRHSLRQNHVCNSHVSVAVLTEARFEAPLLASTCWKRNFQVSTFNPSTLNSLAQCEFHHQASKLVVPSKGNQVQKAGDLSLRANKKCALHTGLAPVSLVFKCSFCRCSSHFFGACTGLVRIN